VRKAVITSPQRRIDLALRLITQGSYQKSHGKGKKMEEALANELIACYDYDSSKSTAIREKERIEREAAGAR
ncbi:MAG: 30S ribosomal protein S7, partial [Candidatus Aenigmatarchaeota archaeon]